MQPLALTFGEPAGIGPDITLAAHVARADQRLHPFYVLGDGEYLTRRARRLGMRVQVATVAPEEAAAAFAKALPVVSIGGPASAEPGSPDASSATVALASLRQGVRDVLAGRAAALVTNPVAKSVLYRAGFDDPGQTEFLARLVREETLASMHPVMMLWSPELAVVPVTTHIPLRLVPEQLGEALIVETGRIVARDLAARFGIERPRLVASGLNPHAGEEGALGDEEGRVIAPALARLRAQGIDIRGPLSADTLFHARARAEYDAALCMFHDQALVAIKTIAFETAVNVTLGLPFVRTSPDHGTAFDIAGSGRADPASLLAALRLAARLASADAKLAA
jgi:4-hydroxythreonine-4-phosphate dehydrogenase